jgi:hypothetical protein
MHQRAHTRRREASVGAPAEPTPRLRRVSKDRSSIRLVEGGSIDELLTPIHSGPCLPETIRGVLCKGAHDNRGAEGRACTTKPLHLLGRKSGQVVEPHTPGSTLQPSRWSSPAKASKRTARAGIRGRQAV